MNWKAFAYVAGFYFLLIIPIVNIYDMLFGKTMITIVLGLATIPLIPYACERYAK